MGRGQ
jgi:hypothetical protein